MLNSHWLINSGFFCQCVPPLDHLTFMADILRFKPHITTDGQKNWWCTWQYIHNENTVCHILRWGCKCVAAEGHPSHKTQTCHHWLPLTAYVQYIALQDLFSIFSFFKACSGGGVSTLQLSWGNTSKESVCSGFLTHLSLSPNTCHIIEESFLSFQGVSWKLAVCCFPQYHIANRVNLSLLGS